MGQELITAQKAITSIEGNAVHAPISISLKSSELGILTGGNGCGKTSFIRAILGELPLFSGTIHIIGKSVRFGDTFRLARSTIRLISQFPLAPDSMTISEYISAWCCNQSQIYHHSRKKDTISEITELIGHKDSTIIGTLSHGQKRLMDIVLATTSEPHILLADEPLAGLAQNKIAWCIDRLNEFRVKGRAVIVVAHKPEKQYLSASWTYEVKQYDQE